MTLCWEFIKREQIIRSLFLMIKLYIGMEDMLIKTSFNGGV